MNKILSGLLATILVITLLISALPIIMSAVRAQPQQSPPPGPAMWLDPENETFNSNTASVGTLFNLTGWINTAETSTGWSAILDFNASQLQVVTCVFSGPGGTESEWFYNSSIPASSVLSFPPFWNNTVGTIGLPPTNFGEAALNPYVPTSDLGSLFVIEFNIIQAPPPGGSLSSIIQWDTDYSYAYDINGISEPGFNCYNCTYDFAGPPTPVLVTCSPNLISAGSPATCTAVVGGSSPTGTINWTTSSSTGYFTPPVCTLSSGICSTTYTDNNTGYFTIMASYSGDLSNLPGSGSCILTVFVNVTIGTNVTVSPTNNFELTFANVTAAGDTIANATSAVNAPTMNNTVGQYYIINVTANFSGNVTVSLAFDGFNMTQQQKGNLTMIQYTPIVGDIVAPFGIVDMKDVAYLARHFGTNSTSPNWDPICDLNGDGVVNMKDIALLARHFGFTANWVDITTYVDTTNNIIYGSTSHFSFIGIH